MEQLGLELTDMLMPWITVLISLIVAVWLKDYATSIAKGLKFKMNPAFNEGDEVLLDGEPAMIVKIGTVETVFGVYSDRGYTWRYVPNERIPYIKLEKVINKDLHLDTAEERAEKLKTAKKASKKKSTKVMP
ncbi:uncharacterized protein METZ01_LOCUS174064 [marine metagenome]|uniref:Uncharacterized protein n=1 Tax=marine metagenome TaxID=408172 RepID=A0A382C596_9ZZZZ